MDAGGGAALVAATLVLLTIMHVGAKAALRAREPGHVHRSVRLDPHDAGRRPSSGRKQRRRIRIAGAVNGE